MTLEAHIARDVALQMEVKLDRLSRDSKTGSIKLGLTVHPDNFPQQLITDPMGQRYVCVLVAVNEDETPKVSGLAKPPERPGEGDQQPSPESGARKFGEMPRASRAAILGADKLFRDWLRRTHNDTWVEACMHSDDDESTAAACIRAICRVTSRADIDRNPEARQAFDAMFTSYDVERKYGRV